jgi:hypothetical protein
MMTQRFVVVSFAVVVAAGALALIGWIALALLGYQPMECWTYILELFDQFDAESDLGIVILIVFALIIVPVVGVLGGLVVRLYKSAH